MGIPLLLVRKKNDNQDPVLDFIMSREFIIAIISLEVMIENIIMTPYITCDQF